MVAKPDEKWGETPCAFVELKPGQSATADELIAWCRDNLARYKVPRHVVFAELPKTSTGKIQKFKLREMAKKRVSMRPKNNIAGRPEVTAERHSAGRAFRDRSGACAATARWAVLVRNEFLSVDPAMRGWVSAVANYSEPVGIGEVMRSFAAGEVVASRHPNFAEGDKVMGMLGWQDYAVVGRQQHLAQGEGNRPAAVALAWRPRA